MYMYIAFSSTESLDDPSVSEVLQSLPFTALLLQSTPSSITQGLAPSDSHPPATSALINSLSQANIQALMRSSVDHSEGDGLELMCSVRAILALLQSIFSSCKVFYLTVYSSTRSKHRHTYSYTRSVARDLVPVQLTSLHESCMICDHSLKLYTYFNGCYSPSAMALLRTGG